MLIYNTIEETLIDEDLCPVTKDIISLWVCFGCPIIECPKEEYCFSVELSN